MIKTLLLSILLLLFPSISWATFPTTGTLSSMAGTNSATVIYPAIDWTQTNASVTWGNDPLGTTSNTAYDSNPVSDGAAIWNASFNGTVEAYYTVATLGASGTSVAINFYDSNSATPNGYLFSLSATTGGWVFIKVTGNSSSSLLTSGSTPNLTSNGDRIGETRSPSGVFNFYYYHSGSWNSIGTYTDTSYSCSYIGFSLGDSGTRISNFGGGTAAKSGFNFGF